MDMSLPLSQAVLEVLGKKYSPAELRAFAKGVLAHIAIQTLYRLEHPGHFIITERLITIGDARVGTISRFGDYSSRGKRLADLAKKAGAKFAPKKVLQALEAEDLWSLLVYLVDLSTNESTQGKNSRKRYDILDFGPLGTSDLWPVKTAMAYEIKPLDDIEKGSTYVTQQTANFTQTVQALGQILQSAFSVRGLLGYAAVPGTMWPPFAYIIPVGPNVLLFERAAPGVIVYEWLSFRRVNLKQLWDLVRKAADQVREAYEKDWSISDEAKAFALAWAAVAVVMVSLGAVAIVAAAGEAVAASVAGRVLLGRLVLGGLSFAATGAQAQGLATPSPLMEAVQYASDPDSVETVDTGKLLNPGEERSGGTGPTRMEATAEKMAEAISQQFVFLYGVKVGRGTDVLDDSGTQYVKVVVADWFRRFLSKFGVDAFLEVFGVAEFNDEAAYDIAQIIVTNGNLFVERDSYGELLMQIVTMASEDILDSLPEGFNDDGEVDEG